jgi:cysteine-rich repeat protein
MTPSTTTEHPGVETRTGRLRFSRSPLAALLIAQLGLAGRAPAACDPGICSGDPCTISGTHLLDNFCTLDFGAKSVTVAATLETTAGGAFTLVAGTLTVQGILRAPGGGIQIVTTGNFRTESVAGSPGRLDVRASGSARDSGWLDIVAGGNVALLGTDVSADGGSARDAGSIWIEAAAINTASPLHANGMTGGIGGSIDLVATSGNVTLGATTAANGGGNNGEGGDVSASATGSIAVTAPVQANGTLGGGGGVVSLDAGNGVSIAAGVAANGSGGGWGGSITAAASGGEITIAPMGSLSVTGSGGGKGGEVALSAAGNVTVRGNIVATGSGSGSGGGFITVSAKPASIDVSSTLDVRSTSSNGFFDGSITLGPACDIRLSGVLRARNPSLFGGTVSVQYRGSFDASGATMEADAGGNVIECRCADLGADGACGTPPQCESPPVLSGATVTPPAEILPIPLGPCLGCGNGIIDDPAEECDDGNLSSGDCCSACRFESSGSRCEGGFSACIDGMCDGAGACFPVPNTGAACNDGNPCTSGDMCQNGECAGSPVPDGTACDGGSCTTGGTCLHGTCAGGSICSPCCQPQNQPRCGDSTCEACVCSRDPFCCNVEWDFLCTHWTTTQCATACLSQCTSAPPTPSPTPTPTPTTTASPTPTATNTPIPECGNGTQEPGEECDDGNSDPGDGCDSSCMLECPHGIERPKIIIRNLHTPAGDDKLIFQGRLRLPYPFGPALDPLANGVRLLVNDTTGAVLDVTIPGGKLASTSAGAGWTVNRKGNKWVYSDRSGAAARGIFKIVIRDRSTRVPGRVDFIAKGKSGAYGIAGGTLLLSGRIILNPPVSHCGSALFPGPPPEPSCVLTSGGRALKCQ